MKSSYFTNILFFLKKFDYFFVFKLNCVGTKLKMNYDLKLINLLDEGTFAQVWKGKWGPQDVAIKIFSTQSDVHWNSFQNERLCLDKLKHPHILLMYTSYENPFRIVVELCDYNLVFWLKKKSRPYRKLFRIVKNISMAVEYIHTNNILHLDLKPENIVILFFFFNLLQLSSKKIYVKKKLLRNGTVKIADFGLSFYRKNQFSRDKIIGTPVHVSPEIISPSYILGYEESKNFQPTEKSDIYSCAILFWEIFHEARDPYPNISNPKTLFEKVCQENYRPQFENDFFHKPLQKFIERMWSKYPNDRPPISEFLQFYENNNQINIILNSKSKKVIQETKMKETKKIEENNQKVIDEIPQISFEKKDNTNDQVQNDIFIGLPTKQSVYQDRPNF